MRSPWIKALVVLAAVWAVAGSVILWASLNKPTPESLVRYVDSQQLEGMDAKGRERALVKVADQLNQLSYEQRREVRVGRKLDKFFRSLTPEEQGRFLDLTLPMGFKQMMDAFNKMEPQKRKDMVDRALSDIRKNEGAEPPSGADDPHVQRIVQQGLRSFYSDANSQVKMDLAPLLEEMQKNLQGR